LKFPKTFFPQQRPLLTFFIPTTTNSKKSATVIWKQSSTHHRPTPIKRINQSIKRINQTNQSINQSINTMDITTNNTIYRFPILKNAEIIDCLSEAGIEINENELVEPHRHKEKVKQVFFSLVS